MKATHTLATLEIGETAWIKVRQALKDAGADYRLLHEGLDMHGVMLKLHDPAMCRARVRQNLINATKNGYVDHIHQTTKELAIDLLDRADDLEHYSLEDIEAAIREVRNHD